MGATDSGRGKGRLPKGVAALGVERGGRGFRASIRRGKGRVVHLGLYPTAWLAGFAHQVAAKALGQQPPPLPEIPAREQPSADLVREITQKVLGRLGLEPKSPRGTARDEPAEADDLIALFEVAVVGFWRAEAARDDWDRPEAALDAAAGRLVEAAGLLFRRRAPGDPTPLEALTSPLGRRLDAAFRRADLTREVLDDDGDDPRRVARWLVHPDAFPNGRARGFAEQVRALYGDVLGAVDPDDDDDSSPGSARWAEVLGIGPPFSVERIREAYRARSRTAHPDAGGTASAFVRLRAAYEAALAYCQGRGG